MFLILDNIGQKKFVTKYVVPKMRLEGLLTYLEFQNVTDEIPDVIGKYTRSTSIHLNW